MSAYDVLNYIHGANQLGDGNVFIGTVCDLDASRSEDKGLNAEPREISTIRGEGGCADLSMSMRF